MKYLTITVFTLFHCVLANINVTIFINLRDPPKYVLDKKYFSVALDTFVVFKHFNCFNMTNPRLHKLVREISPGYLRIGGNMADKLHFSNKSKVVDNYNYSLSEICSQRELESFNDFSNFTMSAKEWIDINNFAKTVGTKILFDLNCLIRNDDGSWNSTNAEELISFSHDNKFDIDWQLGNEPNAFKHNFNYAVNASQLAKDFITLKHILNKFPRYKNSILVGPDVTRPQSEHPASGKYLKQFLKHIKQENVLDAISFHQYYLNGRVATISDFLNPSTFLLLEKQINLGKNIVEKEGFNKTPIWLTETSSAYGGGAPNLSDSFVGSFLWLDKLGLSAKLGIKLVIRQSIKDDYYALIDDHYNPNPDWWISIFFNLYVSPEVLNYNISTSNYVRLYCHCSKKNSKIPTVTIFGINISNSTAKISVDGIRKTNFKSYAYIFTAYNEDLLTKNVLLNGKLLKLSKKADLPVFEKKIVNASKPLIMPKYSLAFWTLPALEAQYC